jgi:hypothetical protein
MVIFLFVEKNNVYFVCITNKIIYMSKELLQAILEAVLENQKRIGSLEETVDFIIQTGVTKDDLQRTEDKLTRGIDSVETSLTKRIDHVESSLTTRMNNLESKLDGVEASLSKKIGHVAHHI